MTNGDHYAIVIGLRRYAGFKDPPADLQGPENDADAVHAWLIDPAGGGLPPENVKRIKSSDEVPPDGRPSRDQLEERGFLWLDELAVANRDKGEGRRVGTRLYLYASGHGFSPEPRQGCLLAGNAAPERASANISTSSWLQWLQDAGYFQEYVLLMDCCMNRMPGGLATAAPLTPISVNEPPAASFIAFAARRALKAVEAPIPEDGGRYHGVFTWALLDGLRGAAADSTGMVTGHGMANWLRHAIYPRLGAFERSDPDVSTEPEIVAEDAALVLASGLAPRLFAITLKLPAAAAGQAGRIWSGIPAAATPFDGKAETALALPAGLHVVEIAGYRHGIEVTRDATVEIAERGEKGNPVAGRFALLSVDSGNAGARVQIARADFETVFAGQARVAPKLPHGLYKVQTSNGHALASQVVLLDRDLVLGAGHAGPGAELPGGPPPDALALPAIASAAPLPGSPMSHEYHEAAVGMAETTPEADLVLGDGAEILLMARSWSPSGNAPDASPWDGVELVDAEGVVLTGLEQFGGRQPTGDPFALRKLRVAPGSYYLRYPAGTDNRLEQALFVPAGWRLGAYLLRRQSDERDGADRLPRLAFLLHGIGRPLDPDDDVLVETAAVALAEGRSILDPELAARLFAPTASPLAAIIGAHMMLLDRDRDQARFDKVIADLRAAVGSAHPDVEALSLHCSDPAARHQGAFETPPLFERSWRLMIEASYADPALVPAELWQRVHALSPLPPFFAWSVSKAVQTDYLDALAEITLGERLRPADGPPPVAIDANEVVQPRRLPRRGDFDDPLAEMFSVHREGRAEMPGVRVQRESGGASPGIGRIELGESPFRRPLPVGARNAIADGVDRRVTALQLPPSALAMILGRALQPLPARSGERHQDRPVGELHAEPRTVGEAEPPADRQLFSDEQ